MFSDIAQVVQLREMYYSWETQNATKDEDWAKKMQMTNQDFCGHRHCHWTAYMDAWEAHMWGNDGKICNRFDETGCNMPGTDYSGVKSS